MDTGYPVGPAARTEAGGATQETKRRGRARRLPQDHPRDPAGARSARARGRLQGDLPGPARGRGGPAGRALHGVRRAVLPRRLPARQPDPRLERPRLPRPLARGDRAAPRHQRLPRVDRADLPGAVRARLRARDQRRPGLDQADRAGDRRARVGGGLDRPAAARAAHAAAASAIVGSGPGRARRRRRSSTAPATRSSSTSATRARAACCASACPTSSSRSGTSTAGSRCWRPRACASSTASTSASDVTAEELCRAPRRRRAGDRLARAPRARRARRRPAGRALRDGLPVRAQPLGRARRRRRATTRS